MKTRFWILVAALALLSSPIMANDLSYTYVQGSWASVDPDVGDSGSGPAFDVSWGLSEQVHLVGSYEGVDFDLADTTTWQFGAGVHRSMPQNFDLVAEATYVDAEVDSGVVAVSEDGFTVCAGARKQVAASWEINGGIEYLDLGNGDDTLLSVNALYSVKDRYALSTGYKVGDNSTLHFGFRFNFGQ